MKYKLIKTQRVGAPKAIYQVVDESGAVVLERLKKDDEKMFLITRLAATGALVIGMANAFFI